MRVIAGNLGGRLFDSPHNSHTHPMSDKIRGALFNMLGDLSNLTVLDAFSGTGALSFEAVSRGAKNALSIESDTAAQKVIKRNIATLDLHKRVQLVQTSANSWLQTYTGSSFDIVLLDPPYDDLQHELVQRLAGQVSSSGLLVLSWPGSQNIPEFNGFELLRHKKYGDAQLVYYRRTTP